MLQKMGISRNLRFLREKAFQLPRNKWPYERQEEYYEALVFLSASWKVVRSYPEWLSAILLIFWKITVFFHPNQRVSHNMSLWKTSILPWFTKENLKAIPLNTELVLKFEKWLRAHVGRVKVACAHTLSLSGGLHSTSEEYAPG